MAQPLLGLLCFSQHPALSTSTKSQPATIPSGKGCKTQLNWTPGFVAQAGPDVGTKKELTCIGRSPFHCQACRVLGNYFREIRQEPPQIVEKKRLKGWRQLCRMRYSQYTSQYIVGILDRHAASHSAYGQLLKIPPRLGVIQSVPEPFQLLTGFLSNSRAAYPTIVLTSLLQNLTGTSDNTF